MFIGITLEVASGGGFPLGGEDGFDGVGGGLVETVELVSFEILDEGDLEIACRG